MKLLYVFLGFPYSGGLERKICDHVFAMTEHGLNVQLAVIAPKGVSTINCPIRKFNSFIKWDTFLEKILSVRKKFEVLRTFVVKLDFDFLYIRYPLADWYSERFFNDFPNVVTEHHHIETKALRGLGDPLGYVRATLEYLYGQKVLRKVKGIVAVTNQILRYERKRAGKRIKGVVIPNGIDVRSVPERGSMPKFNGRRFEMAFIANKIFRWHGLERIIHGMKRFKGSTQLVLHIVGEPPKWAKIKSVPETVNIGKRHKIVFHGFIEREHLNQVLNHAHIAIGSLALFRQGLTEASTLKVREYTAYGIPFIYGSRDPDLEIGNADFYMRVPANTDPIDIESVIEFYKSISTDRDLPKRMRDYAFKYMDWRVKTPKLIDFLKSLK
ncbi:MAG: hypothetical protein DRQ10_08660 [Candidatus Hydrothermota bacterium]|nr:MAG: hypothetical protein DRQ10_08660 [Candidatus Hydrothermae bacterium]